MFYFLGIQIESQRCDEVYSSKFPRHRVTSKPWVFYRDSVYYLVRCLHPRKRRDVSVIDEIKAEQAKPRTRRAVGVNAGTC